ncbi:MAG: long-chain-fatty-acid--CoA ligase [Alphaproteobacteria bacterium]|nr:long-chain-fatty-acid--CoA ligase [Alphaproteobacteria bacterium]
MTLKDIIERNARWHGDALAFKCGERELSHRALRDEAARLAAALYAGGARSQDRIGLLLMNSLEMAVGYAACEAFGLIAATVNFRLAAPEMRHIISDSGASILIFEAEFTDRIDAIRAELSEVRRFVCVGPAPDWATGWDEFVAEGAPGPPPLPAPRPEDIAYLIYTSGTTGRPKGCMLDHAGQCAMGAAMSAHLGLDGQDHSLLVMPLFHIGAKSQVHAQHWVGGAVHLHRKFDAEAVLRTVHEERITLLHLAPMLIQALLEVPDRARFDTSSLRVLIYSAAPMSPTLLRAAREAFGPIFIQMYGQTEGIGTVLPKGDHRLDADPVAQARLGSVGHVFVDTELSIRDDDNAEVPAGQVGEICLRGPCIMRGYWNNSAATLAALAGGWLHTGDVGYVDDCGYVYLVDRKKDVIISGGENIYSREVEDALISHPAVSAVAVVGVPDAKWGEIACACIVLREGAAADGDSLVAHCKPLIAAYKQPRRVVFVDALPALPSGKVNKVALRRIISGEAE